jgi:hypothetical protein
MNSKLCHQFPYNAGQQLEFVEIGNLLDDQQLLLELLLRHVHRQRHAQL